MCESVGKAKLLSAHFDSKQSKGSVNLPSTCHPSPSLTTLASRLMGGVPPWGGLPCLHGRRASSASHLTGGEAATVGSNFNGCTDPLSMSPPFLKRTADVLAPRIDISAAS